MTARHFVKNHGRDYLGKLGKGYSVSLTSKIHPPCYQYAQD